MEQVRQWRAGKSRAGRVHGWIGGRRRLRAAAATGAMVAVTMPALSADGAVGSGRSIEVAPGFDAIALSGYPSNTLVKVEVVRHGFVVGYTTRVTDFFGGFEVNHVGGAAGDCFQSPTSPDLQPTDTIRATVLKRGGATDTSVVRDVGIDNMQFGGTTITVSGHVAVTGPAAVDTATGLFELRINKDEPWDVNDRPGRTDRREALAPGDVQADGTWTHVLEASPADVADARDAETFLTWSSADGTELATAEYGAAEPILGCPPLATGPTPPLLPEAQDSGRVGDNVTSQSTDLTFSGLAGTGVEGAPGPGEPVTLQIDGTDAAQTTADGNGVYEFTGLGLKARAEPHTVRVISPAGHASTRVLVDDSAPRVRVRSFAPLPLHLAGSQRLRAVYNIRERATLVARIDHLNPTDTVVTFARRHTAASGPVRFTWDGTDQAGRDVRPGRYRMVLEVTDRAGNTTVQRNTLRVRR